mgnify:FL=1
MLLLSAIIALVGILGFWIGRYSIPPAASGVVIYQVPGAPESFLDDVVEAPVSQGLEAPPVAAAAATGGAVASKNGEVYYLPHCTGQNRIKPENRVSFPSEAAAVAAGYRKAANCR